MVKAPSKILLIVAIFMALGALVVVNQIGQKAAYKTDEEREQDQERARQEAQSKAPKPAQSAPGAAQAGDLVSLGADAVRGNTNSAAPEVTVRWSWDPATQGDPTKLYSGIQALITAVPQARIHIVNTDETPGTPDGVSVGDKVVTPAASDGSVTIDPSAVKTALGSK